MLETFIAKKIGNRRLGAILINGFDKNFKLIDPSRWCADEGDREENSAKAERGDKSPEVFKGGWRVLIIEDHVDSAAAMELLLRRNGHKVTVAHTAADGLQLAKQQRPQIILIDIGLPDMDGYDAAKAIRSDPEHQVIMMIAMSGYNEDPRRAKEAGFDQHLLKPLDFRAVKRLLRQMKVV